MKYYMASDEKNMKQVRSLIKKLTSKGFACVNDWNLQIIEEENQLADGIGEYEKRELRKRTLC